ncbi:MAG: hypothetical protein E7434_02315 [Ruminococcaceae bacterium]|nr:hypothetical protein [Oscillospiraceae bacterium]
MRIPYRNKLLMKKILRVTLISLIIFAVFFVALLIYMDSNILYDRQGAHLSYDAPTENVEEIQVSENIPLDPPEIIYMNKEPEEQPLSEVGGYYITTSMLQEPEKVLEQLKTIQDPCAVMIELKSIFGNFYYSTSIGGAQTASVDITVVDSIIQYLREHGFYMIASVAAFSDYNFALDNQTSGLPLKSGALWMDENGCYWLDPASETVISYLMQITRELSALGFKEVAFSDFRFPVSNNIHYESDLTGTQIIQNAAEQLTNFFQGSNVTVSFSVKDTDFPAEACAGRLYVSEVDGSKVERYNQIYGEVENLKELVFLANSRDTRFDELAVLRPLMSQ